PPLGAGGGGELEHVAGAARSPGALARRGAQGAALDAQVPAEEWLMDALRTPDHRFRDLPGYSFAPHYLESGGIRVHYVDEGPPAAAPVLMLHGEPSWSYLYRKMIPRLTAAGHRVIAPDLVGFGRSDKPAAREDYTYQRHVDWIAAVLTGLDLRATTL